VIAIINPDPEDKLGEIREGDSRFQELREAPFPRAAREFTGRTIDQTRDAYERCSSTLDAAVQILGTSFAAAGHSAAALRRNILDTAQRNLNLGFDLAKNLAGTSNLFELVELQAAYWRQHFDTFTTQAENVRDRQCEFGGAKEAEPFPKSHHHAPAKKATSLGHETPKARLNPATRDPERLKQSPIKLRPSDEIQSRTRTKGAVEAESRRRQRSTLRVSAGEGGGQKPEPRSPSVVASPPEARPPDETTGTAKQGVARGSSANLATGIKFGKLDGNAVPLPALRLGGWSMALGGRSLQRRSVKCRRDAGSPLISFPELPRLPSKAFKTDKFQS
jgi:hypothetical protein